MPNYSNGYGSITPKTGLPENTYKGPINNSINGTAQGDELVEANKAQAAALGISIPGKEPAVVSSTGASDMIDESKKKMEDMLKKGTSMSEKGPVYADGSLVPAPQGSTYNAETGQYEATAQEDTSVEGFYGTDGGAPNPEYAAIDKLFAPLKANLDANTLAHVSAIQQSFESLKAMQVQFNEAAMHSRTTSLLDNGTRYSPGTMAGITLMQASDGLNRIANWDAKENAALAEARAAQEAGDMELMTKKITMAEGIRKDKQNAAAGVMEKIQKANDDLAAQHAQMQKDDAVAEQMANGETDPAKILKALNEAGLGITADEVSKSIKNLTPAVSKDDAYTFSNADVGKLFAAGLTAPVIKQVQDFYNGKGDAPALDEAQTAAVHKILAGTTTGATGGYTPTEQRKLEQAGLSDAPRQEQLDFLYGGKDDTEKDDYESAKKFIEDNPNASREELSAGLHENTKLSVSDINALLDEKGATKEETSIAGKESSIAVQLVKALGFQEAKDAVDAGDLDVNDKTIKLSARQKKALKDAIDKEYPDGRTFMEKVLPWGK